jgi:hypothetical protein
MALLKLNEHVNIAFRPKVRPQNRTEKRELANVMAMAEASDLLSGHFKRQLLHWLSPVTTLGAPAGK